MLAEMRFTHEFLEDFPGADVDIQHEVAQAFDHEVYRLCIGIQAHKGEPIVIGYPRDWWEAVKLRFAPVWFLQRRPVQMTTHRIHPWAILPDLKTPPGQRVLRWAEHEAPDFRRWHIEDDYARPTQRQTPTGR
jgi:hypothetical protein